jgi:hypothetical protein
VEGFDEAVHGVRRILVGGIGQAGITGGRGRRDMAEQILDMTQA